MFRQLKIRLIQAILRLIDEDHRVTEDIAMDDMKKFTHTDAQDFDSDFGHVSMAYRTVPYEVWKLDTETKTLIAADKHRVVAADGSHVWLQDLKAGDKIQTNIGVETVVSSKSLNIRTHMYCVQVDTKDPKNEMNHLYYTNGILSHNTTCAAAFILWKAMFEADSTILIAANKYVQAIEIMDKVKFAYENLEQVNWLRAGITEYNKGTISFDNGSRVISRATASDAGRGLAISLLYCLAGDTMVTVRDKTTMEVKDISLADLHSELSKDQNDDTCFISWK